MIIEKGDIITYRCGRTNYVNKPDNYMFWFNDKLENIGDFGAKMDIMKVQRYVKFLCFYRLKTIYERVEK